MPKVDMPTVQDLEKTDVLTNDDVIWFGKYNGQKLIDIPDSYFYWLYDQDWLRGKFPELADYCENVLEGYDPHEEEVQGDCFISWKDD